MAEQQRSTRMLSDMATVLEGVEWYEFGIHLGVPRNKLNAIKQECDSIQRKLIEVLSYQFDNGEMSWEKIIEALKKIGRYTNLILLIESKHVTQGQYKLQATAISTIQPESATPTGTENEGLNGAAGNEQVVTEMVEKMVIVKTIDQMSSYLDGSKEVKIGDEIHSLDVVPAPGSKVVIEEKDMLLGAIDLKTLVDDLGHAGAFIRIAYNGVMAAGPRYTELQSEIRQLGIDITKLCNESALTVFKFKTTSTTVLSHLQATYGYLLRNKANLAIDILSSVSELAEQMKKAALKLQEKFEKKEKEVTNTFEKTHRARADAAIRKEEKEKEQQQLQIQLQHKQQVLEDAQRLEQEAEADRRRKEAKEDEAISGIKHIGVFKSLVNGILRYEVFDEGLRKVDRLREKRIQASETETKRRKQRYEAMENWTAYTIMVQNCKSEQEMAKGAEEALQKTARELNELSIVMIQAAEFWEQIHEYCKPLIEERVKLMVRVMESTNKDSEADRMKTWTSHPFKEQAIRFYAGWVALNTVCSEYAEHIKKTQKVLYKYIKEYPTYEEARRNIHELAETFRADLRKEMDALEQTPEV